MTLLTKIRTPVLTVGLRNVHRSTCLLSDHDFDEQKFLMEEKPWKNPSPRTFGQLVPNPHPILHEDFDEHHGYKLIPVWWVCLIAGIIPVSVYGWWQEYNHLFVHRHRIPHPKQDFLYGESIRSKLPYGDGKHTLMHNYYWNFVKEGYETDKDGNRLPPGEYVDE